MAMKWRREDEVKLQRYVQKFNASITKLEKKEPDIAQAGIYPEKITVKDLKQKIGDRRDFNRQLKKIDRWFKKGARAIVNLIDGLKTTKWAKQEAQYEIQSINKRREKLRKKMDIYGKFAEAAELQDINFKKNLEMIHARVEQQRAQGVPISSIFENELNAWQGFLEQVSRKASETWDDKRNQQYYYNYHKALYEKLTPEHARMVGNLIDDLNLSGFQLFILTQFNDRTDIPFVYGPEDEEARFASLMEEIPKTYMEIMNESRKMNVL